MAPASAATKCSSGIALLLLLALMAAGTSWAQLSTSFYSSSCPGVYDAVKSVMKSAIATEQRMGASTVRLFFHDCFVQVLTNTTNKYMINIYSLKSQNYLLIIMNLIRSPIYS